MTDWTYSSDFDSTWEAQVHADVQKHAREQGRKDPLLEKYTKAYWNKRWRDKLRADPNRYHTYRLARRVYDWCVYHARDEDHLRTLVSDPAARKKYKSEISIANNKKRSATAMRARERKTLTLSLET